MENDNNGTKGRRSSFIPQISLVIQKIVFYIFKGGY